MFLDKTYPDRRNEEGKFNKENYDAFTFGAGIFVICHKNRREKKINGKGK